MKRLVIGLSAVIALGICTAWVFLFAMPVVLKNRIHTQLADYGFDDPMFTVKYTDIRQTQLSDIQLEQPAAKLTAKTATLRTNADILQWQPLQELVVEGLHATLDLNAIIHDSLDSTHPLQKLFLRPPFDSLLVSHGKVTALLANREKTYQLSAFKDTTLQEPKLLILADAKNEHIAVDIQTTDTTLVTLQSKTNELPTLFHALRAYFPQQLNAIEVMQADASHIDASLEIEQNTIARWLTLLETKNIAVSPFGLQIRADNFASGTNGSYDQIAKHWGIANNSVITNQHTQLNGKRISWELIEATHLTGRIDDWQWTSRTSTHPEWTLRQTSTTQAQSIQFKLSHATAKAAERERVLSLVIPTSQLQIDTPTARLSAELYLQAKFSQSTALKLKEAHIQLNNLKIHPHISTQAPFTASSLTAKLEPNHEQSLDLSGSIQLEGQLNAIPITARLPIGIQAFLTYLITLTRISN